MRGADTRGALKSMIAIARRPVVWMLHASRRPSGEASGSAARAWRVSRCTMPPDTLTAYRSDINPTERTRSS